jgi:hypothetical protein
MVHRGVSAVVAFNPASAGLFFESPWRRFNHGRAERPGRIRVRRRAEAQVDRGQILKDHSARAGIDVSMVRVDKTEGKVDDASAKLAGDSL